MKVHCKFCACNYDRDCQCDGDKFILAPSFAEFRDFLVEGVLTELKGMQLAAMPLATELNEMRLAAMPLATPSMIEAFNQNRCRRETVADCMAAVIGVCGQKGQVRN